MRAVQNLCSSTKHWADLFRLLVLVVLIFPGPGAAETDLILCNSTPLPVSTAIAYKAEQEWRAKGWFSVEPGDCVVPELSTNNTVVYAHAISGDVEWGGEHEFCIDPAQAFHFHNRPGCASTAAFREHKVTGNVAYTINYECQDCDYIPTPKYYKNGPPLKVYGKWCGPGYPKGFDPGPPIDVIDTACFEHDQKYVQCSRILRDDLQLNCELEADSNLMSQFRTITESDEHGLDPARLAYVSTMIRYLSYQAQLKYKTGQARGILDQGRTSLTAVMNSARKSVAVSSAELAESLKGTWTKVIRGPSQDNPIFGREGWLRQKVGYTN